MSGVARCLLRNGSLLSIEVEPKLIDVLVLETLVVNTSTPLFQRVLNIDCSRLGMRLDRVHVKNGTVKRTIKSYFRLLEFAKSLILWLVIFCGAVNMPTSMLIRTI